MIFPKPFQSLLIPFGSSTSSGAGLSLFSLAGINKGYILRLTARAAPLRYVFLSSTNATALADVTAAETVLTNGDNIISLDEVGLMRAEMPIEFRESGGSLIGRGVITSVTASPRVVGTETDSATGVPVQGAGNIRVRRLGTWASSVEATDEVYGMIPNLTAFIGDYLTTGAEREVGIPSWAAQIGFIRDGGTDATLEVAAIGFDKNVQTVGALH
jgi:hypothetical protein